MMKTTTTNRVVDEKKTSRRRKIKKYIFKDHKKKLAKVVEFGVESERDAGASSKKSLKISARRQWHFLLYRKILREPCL